MLKQLFKFSLFFVGGAAFGLLVAVAMIVAFTDTTFAEVSAKLGRVDIVEGLLVLMCALVSMVVSVFVLITVHEGGHLVCGLATGYRFVSFRILNFTIIRENGRLRVKRFAVAGTGGQCLLSPPERPLDEIPTGWYDMGGVLANVVVLAAALPLLWADVNPFVAEAAGIFVIIDIVLILLNGIPMSAGGIGNDGANLMLLRRSLLSKRGMVTQLRSNALIQAGVRPRDMPDGWFEFPDEISYRNTLEVSLPVMAASRLVDMERFYEAYAMFDRLYDHRDEIMQLYVKEIACELVFLSLATGRAERAAELLDEPLKKYIRQYSDVMSSKQRLLFAIELCMNRDREAARAILDRLESRADDYLLQGEVKSDLALMRGMMR